MTLRVGIVALVLALALILVWVGLGRIEFDIPCQDGDWDATLKTCVPDPAVLPG